MPTRKYNQNTLELGQWNVLCDVCGFKFKSGDIKKRWDGLMVCHDDYEERHISDFFHIEGEDTSVPYVRLDTVDTVTIQHGDTDATIYMDESNTHNWNVDLTADRVVTLKAATPVESSYWTSGEEGAASQRSTLTHDPADGTLIFTPSAIDSNFYMSTIFANGNLDIDGSVYQLVRLRAKKTDDTGSPTWEARCWPASL